MPVLRGSATPTTNACQTLVPYNSSVSITVHLFCSTLVHAVGKSPALCDLCLPRKQLKEVQGTIERKVFLPE